MIDTATETRCKNPNCGKPVHQQPGHRKREYCNDTCKQTAYRLRKEQPYHGVTVVDESTKQRIAELEAELALSQQNLAVYQEKLSQTSSHMQKLERQVETQRQRLGQYTSELARYRKVVDLDDRQKMIADFMLTGEEIGYKALASVDVRPGPHAWYAFSQTADTEHLAAAIVAARNVYKQLAGLRTTTEVEKLNALVADLRQKLRECEKRKQS